MVFSRSGSWFFPVLGSFACLSVWFVCMIPGLYKVIQYTLSHFEQLSLLSDPFAQFETFFRRFTSFSNAGQSTALTFARDKN